MGYYCIQKPKITGKKFFSPFSSVNDLVLQLSEKNSPQSRIFYNLNKMCFYYENFQHV